MGGDSWCAIKRSLSPIPSSQGWACGPTACTYTVEFALLGRWLSGSDVLLGHFIWNGITSVRMCTKLHRLIGSNIRFIGPVNSEPRVDTSKMLKRTDLSLAKKIALLDNELHAVFHRPVVSLCAVKGTSQRLLECLHVSCSARFQDESVLAQICLGMFGPVPTQAKCRWIASARF